MESSNPSLPGSMLIYQRVNPFVDDKSMVSVDKQTFVLKVNPYSILLKTSLGLMLKSAWMVPSDFYIFPMDPKKMDWLKGKS